MFCDAFDTEVLSESTREANVRWNQKRGRPTAVGALALTWPYRAQLSYWCHEAWDMSVKGLDQRVDRTR